MPSAQGNRVHQGLLGGSMDYSYHHAQHYVARRLSHHEERCMKIGIPKEIKNHEYRVGLTPPSVAELVAAGHEVFVEALAGNGIDFSDRDYMDAGARILPNASEVFVAAEMIVKVKEPQPSEIAMLRPHHVLFTYLHLAPDPAQAEGLMKSGATCIAYETVTSR
jgi:alanine dehydrogenase